MIKAGEKVRWEENAVILEADIQNLLGNMLLAVGSISYLGAFTQKFRTLIIQQHWAPAIEEQGIVCAKDFSLISCLGDELEIQDWIINGLPLDDLSKENAIIMKHSEK